VDTNQYFLSTALNDRNSRLILRIDRVCAMGIIYLAASISRPVTATVTGEMTQSSLTTPSTGTLPTYASIVAERRFA